jgi:hypothetical protein
MVSLVILKSVTFLNSYTKQVIESFFFYPSNEKLHDSFASLQNINVNHIELEFISYGKFCHYKDNEFYTIAPIASN